MLCPINIDFILEGYYTMERHSFIRLNYKRCVNTTENKNNCYPNDIIEKYISMANIDSKIQDIELTPEDHDNPIQHLEREISGATFKGLYQTIFVELKIVIIETDENIFGFEAFSNTKVENYLKYDSTLIIPSINPNENSNSNLDLNEITIQLSPNILNQKRNYVQLIDVLGDVGGLMEIINMAFGLICSVIVDILYEKSLVNNLFSFDLDRKIVILKNKNNPKSFCEKTEILNLNNNKEMETINQIEKDENVSIKRQKRKFNIKKLFYDSQSNDGFYQGGNNKSSKVNLSDCGWNKKNNFINYFNTVVDNNVDEEKGEKNNNKVSVEKSQNVIKKIKLNKLYIHLGFCFVRNIDNINNILFDEGMRIITERLDILNIFRQLFIKSEREQQLKEDIIKDKMSDECKKNIDKIINNIKNG